MRGPGELSNDLAPVRRPHFALRDGQLFFLISRRAHMELDAEDVALWNRIDGVSTIAELRASVPDLDARLGRLWDCGACELAPSSATRDRRRILVLEPHMDDAVLSVGGQMWARRNECEFTVVTVASKSNFTSYHFLDREFFDVDEVSALRKAESELAMRLVGGRHAVLDLPEAPLRFQSGNWTLEWYRRHRKVVDAFIAHAAVPAEIDAWTVAIEAVLRDADADELWLPLGAGGHSDHELTRNACLRALHRLPGIERRVELFFYQDVPYAGQFPTHTDVIVRELAAAGATLEAQREDVTQWFDAKLRLVSVFASQFKLAQISPAIEAVARHVGRTENGWGELRFRISKMPAPIDPLRLYSRRAAVEPLITRLSAWRRRHRSDERIRILSPVPFARWTEDFSLLLEAFPKAVFETHISREYASEAESSTLPRIDVRIVDGRERAWLERLARLAAAPRQPTILLTGEALHPWSLLARALFPFSDPVVATRMNDLSLALRAVARDASDQDET